MTFNFIRIVSPATHGLVICVFLLLAAAQAQTTDGTTILYDWRTSFNQQLDGQLELLSTPQGVASIRETSGAPVAQKASPRQPDALARTNYLRIGRSLPFISSILESRGLPASLIGVVAAESGFNPSAFSNKGAAGLWQLMPATARQYGLIVSANRDDRLDAYKSTLAATSYLQELYDQFGDWPLVLAAYNAGANRVRRGLERFHAQNFWTLQHNSALPDETLAYVPKVLAAMSSGLASQDLAPLGGSWNVPQRALPPHPPYPNRESKIVLAITASEAFAFQNTK